jgi:hypothetical protein
LNFSPRDDRVQIAGRWHRIHQEDCCQALGDHPGSKYENEGGPGFAQIMSLLESTDRSIVEGPTDPVCAGLVVLKEVQVRGMRRDVLAKLLDGLTSQCKTTKRKLG